MFSLLAPLASLLGIELEALTERLQRHALVWAIVSAFAVVAAIFLLVAANSALTLAVGPVVAPLIMAGTALFIALVVYLAWHVIDSAEVRREVERKRSSETTALVTTAALAALPMLLKSSLLKRVGIPAGGALAAAYLLSRRTRNHHDE